MIGADPGTDAMLQFDHASRLTRTGDPVEGERLLREVAVAMNHEPADKAAFGVINSAFFAVIYSLSMFNKKFEEGGYSFGHKIKFTARNAFTLAAIYGCNQYIEEWFRIRQNRRGREAP